MAKCTRRTAPFPIIEVEPQEFRDVEAAFSPETEKKIAVLKTGELTAAAGLSALTSLLGEAIHAEKTKIERIKVMDKLLNTGKALLEAKIKCEDAAALTERLDRLEKFMADRLRLNW